MCFNIRNKKDVDILKGIYESRKPQLEFERYNFIDNGDGYYETIQYSSFEKLINYLLENDFYDIGVTFNSSEVVVESTNLKSYIIHLLQ